MKLVSFNYLGFAAAAVLDDESATRSRILPLSTAADDAALSSPVSMADVLEDWQFWRDKLGDFVASAPGDAWLPLDTVELTAPVPEPRHLFCIGLNYRDHASETGAAIPTEPIVFAKHPSSVIATGQAIVLPEASDMVDFEIELAVVIGMGVYRASPEEAMAAVAGYTVFNDISARDWQGRTSQWMPSKSFPTFGPMGPALVIADAIDDVGNLGIRLEVNGTRLQDSSTSELIFGVAELVSYLSAIWPLVPGDVIATGTPAGVGFTRQPPIFLKSGDRIEATIEGIGTLTNTVIAERELVGEREA